MALPEGKLYPDCRFGMDAYINDIQSIIVGLIDNNQENNPTLSTGYRLFDADCNGAAVNINDVTFVNGVRAGDTTLEPGTLQFRHMVEALTLRYQDEMGFVPNAETGGNDISFLNIVQEFGGTGKHGLSEYYRGGPYVPDIPENINIPKDFNGQLGAPDLNPDISLQDFYGSSNLSTWRITENLSEINLNNAIFNAEPTWFPISRPLRIIIDEGVYIDSNSSDTAAISLNTGLIYQRIIIENNGYIIGKGGNGGSRNTNGEDGGYAILITGQNDEDLGGSVKIINNGYIAGGGGGGGGGIQTGGGGGAGGGNGAGPGGGAGAVDGGTSGSNSVDGGNNTQGKGGTAGGSGGGVQENKGGDSISGGGGGGKILPGTGVNAPLPVGNKDDWAGGYGGGPEQAGGNYSRLNYQDPSRTYGNVSRHGAGGGGGWGAGGGSSIGSGGAAGSAIEWKVHEPDVTNNGTIYGAIKEYEE